MDIYRLVSNDGVVFKVSAAIVKQSEILTMLVEDNGFTEKDDDLIPLPKVNARILSKIIEWLNRYKNVNKAEMTQEEEDRLTAWTQNFLKVDQPTMFDLILASSYLEIATLKKASCQFVAEMMRGKEPEQLRRIFNVENDFTREEEEIMKKEQGWDLLEEDEMLKSRSKRFLRSAKRNSFKKN